MGCDCCKIDDIEKYTSCMKLKEYCESKRIFRNSLCGGIEWGKGSNYTPPKPKKKKRKKK